MTREEERLKEAREGVSWKEWGPYLSERQWATVREDYTESGNVWESVVHDHSRSKAYRWGEDGIGGFSNSDQRICFSWAFWNGNDSIIKERLFGLTSYEGNHGEDVKELYYYLDSTPTHSYMKMLYKYPFTYPYGELVDKNVGRSKSLREFELLDTGVFDFDEYFDIFLHYAKNNTEDFLFSAEIHNRSEKEAEIVVMPTIWFRNTWASGRDKTKPKIKKSNDRSAKLDHHILGSYNIYFDDQLAELAFCDNETNRKRLYGSKSSSKYPKDGINDYVVDGDINAVNPKHWGTKGSGIYRLKIPAGSSITVKLRMTKDELTEPFSDFDQIFDARKSEADEFYNEKHAKVDDEDLRSIQRQAWAGMMWSKQFYYYNIRNWLHGDPGRMKPSSTRKMGRNANWQHMFNHDIISMPDKWEYPWYAAWDLAFHCIPIARIDPDFAKGQLLLLLQDRYLHPNGQIPAYEWNFSDVNPPVHAWAVLRVFEIDRRLNDGKADYDFLQKCFHKLCLNFTWWVNRKDEEGNNVFEGGFLGLDNIGVFDRNHPAVEDAKLEQADSTSWMAMFSLNMLKMALDLSMEYPVYQDMASKFFEHFLYISGAMNSIGDNNVDLWDEEDFFYYDVMHTPDKPNQRMKIRSMVGLIPLYAIEILRDENYENLTEFRERLEFFLKERPRLASLVSRWESPGKGERRLLSILRGFRMKKILDRMLDPEEFLSDFGIRALSKYHEKHPYVLETDHETLSVSYLPGESDSSFFGGNSNWRGPIWFPVNYLIMESLLKFSTYYSEEFKVEFPKGSGERQDLVSVTRSICRRLMAIFQVDENGKRPVYGGHLKFQTDPHFKDHILFYEYFNGDTGEGLGASHQTGWTGLIAEMIHRYYNIH
ncbi:glucosidase [Marinoscillum sp. MHG1-6]|uniref:MGH1-like glycoside hydrolase domain-containing protein n=1 Tax=Marinoscillum sp. MHG1-6 TaxID=2959627 RepID=UPI002158433D|nr:glucosidase [Marinoscillum sp. MHG1-6]